MDPDENLRRQRRLTVRILRDIDVKGEADRHEVDELCELVTALDQWIMKGGFFPKDWHPVRTGVDLGPASLK